MSRFLSSSRRGMLAAAALAALLFASPAVADDKANGDDSKSADVPVRRVVMFSSGVTFFEHRGQVEGDASVELKFNVRDINDLLKSMVVEDAAGNVAQVSYGSRDPITRTLRSFAIDLTENPTLASLLAQIRGEKVMLEAPTPVEGVILGVETRKKKIGKGEVVEVEFLNLLTDKGLRSIALASVGKIKLADPKLDAELRQALAVLAQSNSVDKKTVNLSFRGKGERPVRVGYIQESPIWKTSYRLVLGDENKTQLQGWAIVENTTESDWTNVVLTLVSGRPISFVMDLYQPLYINRPVVEPELYASLRPRTYDQDLEGAEQDFRRAGQAKAEKKLADRTAATPGFGGRSAPAAPPAKPKADYLRKAPQDSKWNLQQGVQSVAQAAEVGELFKYEIATPVTIARGSSAMLPIVNESVEAEKVSIYNPSVHAKHPLNGLRLKNSTELHLMQGPVTVFDDGTYAGDAQIRDIAPGSERLISYAMDLGTEVAQQADTSPSKLVSVKIVKGTLYAQYKHQRKHEYVVKNSGRKVKKVLIEYPYDSAWTLLEPEKPAEKTRSLYRFAVEAKPGEPAKLAIREERINTTSVALTNVNYNSIVVYLKAPQASDKVKAALQEVIKRKNALNAVVSQRQNYDRELQIIEREQDRIRRNMQQLDRNNDLYRRYVTKFAAQEDKVEELRKKQTAAIAQEQKLRKELDDYLSSLSLD